MQESSFSISGGLSELVDNRFPIFHGEYLPRSSPFAPGVGRPALQCA